MMMLIPLFFGILSSVFNIQSAKAEPGTIYIRANGSIDPQAANITTLDNVTYRFTSNNYDGIVIEKDNIVVDGVGYTLQGIGASVFSRGIDLTGRNNVTIKDMKIVGFGRGIHLNQSSGNKILGNNIGNANWSTQDAYWGIHLTASDSNSICGNSIESHVYGINLIDFSEYNIVSANTIIDSDGFAIALELSPHNTISENSITNNDGGIWFKYSPDNFVYHNNFVNNTPQVDMFSWATNSWADEYPSGGNYWSDYTSMDMRSGPNQDQPSSDGIGDTQYVVGANNIDHYPLMYPWGSTPPPSYTISISSSPIEVTFKVDGIPRTTPWSGIYSEGSLVTLEMPQYPDGYIWSQWLEDSDINKTKTVVMDTNKTLTVTYTPLAVGGIYIPTNKLSLLAPYIALTIPLAVPAVAVAYVKKRKKLL